MTPSAIEHNDARMESRHETLKGASILFGNERSDLPCLIRNISNDGAELELVSDDRLPQFVILHVPHQGLAYRAEVRWREPGRIGVMFYSVEPKPRHKLAAV